ncbi:sce7726 family protein [Vibrio mediterranei]|uniref:Sce7726 family protein n=1 Tax=Vibrio mediterranei TaxID=689 RepID=A0AAN1KM75_9VIBR|nr:sce7726 family protein [Vibrio mediterranei]ASI89116.1 hypothetical protein BSZ05_04465 [Vibrio mediterranei]
MEYKTLAKIFNSSELKKVATGNFSALESVREKFTDLQAHSNLLDIYETAYHILLKGYRNEYIVKNEIANKILLGRHSMNTSAMVSELRTGMNIADCVVVNGHSVCYEIKTKMDSLARLEDQLSSYLKAYEKTYVVTHKSHLEHIKELHHKNPKFGIIELTQRNNFKTIEPAPLSLDFDFEITFETLRKPEYVFIAESIIGRLPDMPNTEIYQYCKEVYFSLSKEDANHLFKLSLKKFRANDHTFINSLPKALKNVGISYQFSRQEKNNLVCSLMNNKIDSSGECNVLPLHERQKA